MIATGWDCHVHVFGPFERFPLDPARLYTPMAATCDALAAHLARVGAGHVTLVQPSPYGADHRCLIDALDRLGDRARGVAAWRPDAAAPAHRAIAGLRVHLRDCADPAATLEHAGRAAAESGKHLEIQGGAPALDAYAGAVAALGCAVVLDHLAGLGRPDDPPAAIDALARLLDTGRVWVKYSAPYRAKGTLDDFVARARWIAGRAPTRLMWGSDWPHTPAHPRGSDARLDPAAFRAVDAAALRADMLACFDPAARTAIAYANAAALYASDAPASPEFPASVAPWSGSQVQSL
jgi:predicted TIM-barrel fold metal-dependent hydrolase